MADVKAFEVIMESLLDKKLKPVSDNILALNNKFDEMNISLKDVQESAEHANVVAKEALDITSQLHNRVAKLERDLESSNNSHEQLQEHILRLETYSRRCNLKFSGVAESTGERCLSVIESVLSEMDIDSRDIGIVVAHRIGKYSAKPV